jgi:hypothetical protein
MATDKDRKAGHDTTSGENLETPVPMSERDEVKQAEERTRDLQEKAKEFSEEKKADH